MFISDFGLADLMSQVDALSYLFDENNNTIQCCLNAVRAAESCTLKQDDIYITCPKVNLYHSGGMMTLRIEASYKGRVFEIERSDIEKENLPATCKALFKSVMYSFGVQVLMRENADLLTRYVNAILHNSGISTSVEFDCGDFGIYNLRDNSIGIKLKACVLLNLTSLMLEGNAMAEQHMQSEIVKTFSALPCVIECLRRRTDFSVELQFYTWKSARNIFRQSYHIQACNCRSGIGYRLKDNKFSLIDTRVCNDAELEFMKSCYDKVYVQDNTEPHSHEYIVAHNKEELERLETRFAKREHSNYRVLQRSSDNTCLVVHKLYIARAYSFHPVNLDTYEVENLSDQAIDFIGGVE